MTDLKEVFDEKIFEKITSLQPKKIVYIVRRGDEAQDFIEDDRLIDVFVNVFTRREDDTYKADSFKINVKKSPTGSLKPIKEVLIAAIKRKLLDRGDHVLCIGDESVSIGYKGVLFLIDVDDVLFNISMHHLSDNISSHIIEAVIDIAAEIGLEGREGKPVGTGFIIGDKSIILPYVKQLVLNPFVGYAERKLKITDPELRETVKEFAQLDGVFIIDNDGSIVTSGAYIDINTDGTELPMGFGTRHRNLAAITKAIDCLAIVVSSSGTIRVFKEGNIVMKL